MLLNRFRWWLLLLAGVFLLPGCAGETAVSPTPTALPATATLPVSPTATQPPTATITPYPSATATATPSATPAPTATPTITPTPEPTISGLLGPDNFPANVNPLTGETVRNPAILARRPLAIKISNAPALVRPQAGLSRADLVFEHLVEAGFTRFTAVFYSQDADPIGSVRSGRLIDLEIPRMYDAAFAYSGSVGPVRLMFQESSFFDRLITIDFGHGGFYRVDNPALPRDHTLFTDTARLRYLLDERGENTPPQLPSGMTFRAEPISPGEPASALALRYPATNINWFYDRGNGRYLRWTDGQPHLDANTEGQLSFKNIIVLAAHHQETNIIEDTGGNYSIQIQIWGEGPVSIFRDGQRFDGRWQRHDPDQMLTFYDENGRSLPLAPGPSFFQIVPLGFDGLQVTP